MNPTRKWTRQEIALLIDSNPEFRKRALLKLYSRQTADEQNTGTVNRQNGRGFRSCDARILTSLSKFCESRRFLTTKQDAILLRKLPVYTGQLTDIANFKR